MRSVKYRGGRAGKQSFPAPNHSNFPQEELGAMYALNLLPRTPLHQEFFELVFGFIGMSCSARVVLRAFDIQQSAEEARVVLKEREPEDLARRTIQLLDEKRSGAAERALRNHLREALEEAIPLMPGEGAYKKRRQRLQEMLELDKEGSAILECFACYQINELFGHYCDSYPASDWVSLFAVALKLPVATVRSRVLRGGALAKKGLLEIGSQRITVNDDVVDYLSGLSKEFLSKDDFTKLHGSDYPLSSFPVTEQERALLLETLHNPAPGHLFFYGRPGTGKTELAKALADQAGRQAFLVKYGSDGDERDRRGAITATMGMVPRNAVIIIDEADGLLNTATLFQKKDVDKGWINNFMDECKHKVIWIANETRSIETSVLRRFSYSLEFKKFIKGQRASVWNTQLKRHPLRKVIRPPMVERLARDYEVDAGGIASALKAAENIFTNRTPPAAEVEQTLGQLLEHHEKLSGVDRKKKKLNRLSPNYDVNALHTDLPVENLLQSLRHREKAKLIEGLSLPANIMFWGVPGTGKTEFAKYIAQELGKELLIKRMSDLQSMYVGQTEKQIAEAFEEAEKEGAVLFLDEADSLILDRKTASRSWESSQTNEVLTQMENFKGVCICCTNLLDHLDEAALRRFTWKIKFLPLTDDGKEKLFCKYFQPRGRLSSEIRRALKEIHDLTPGDFKTVWQRGQYASEAALPLEDVKALKKEASYKRTRTSAIGFAV